MKILALLLLIVFALADSCGGNCPNGNCPTCFCGIGKNMVDIATWCSKYTWNQNCCKCIVSHESGGNAHAVNYNANGSSDVGLWQLNTVINVLFRLTGMLVVEEAHHVIPVQIWHAL